MILPALILQVFSAAAGGVPYKRLAAGLAEYGYEERQTLLITFNRTDCSTERVHVPPPCPDYEVRLHGDGLLLYRGYRGVKVAETRTELVPDETVVKLLARFKDSGFLSMKDEYGDAPKDEIRISGDVVTNTRPWVKIGLRMNGEEKRVRHYTGDKSAPKALLELEAAIDAILRTDRWTK